MKSKITTRYPRPTSAQYRASQQAKEVAEARLKGAEYKAAEMERLLQRAIRALTSREANDTAQDVISDYMRYLLHGGFPMAMTAEYKP